MVMNIIGCFFLKKKDTRQGQIQDKEGGERFSGKNKYNPRII